MLFIMLIAMSFALVSCMNDKYEKMTKAEFAGLLDEELFDACGVWSWKYHFKTNPAGYYKVDDVLRNFIAIYSVDAQVLNGGFNQFYYNGYGDYGIDYAKAFEAAEMYEVAKIIKEAEEIYQAIEHTLPKMGSSTIEEISKSYENNPLNYFSSKYAERQEESKRLILNYIKKNIGSFGD